MGIIGNVDMLGWITAAVAVFGCMLCVAQMVRSLGQYEQRIATLERAVGPDFESRKGRDDERWKNLFGRLDDFDDRLERIERNGNGRHA